MSRKKYKYNQWQYDFVAKNYKTMPIAELMAKANVPKSFIGNIRFKLKLQKKKRLNDEEINYIEYWHNKGLNPHQIAKKMEISYWKVHYQISKLNTINEITRNSQTS